MSSASDQDDTDGGSRLHARIIQTADSIQEIQDISPELPLEVPDSQPGSPLQREIPDSQESLNNFDSEYEEDFPIGDAESLPPANEVCQNLEDETDLATRHWSTSDEEHLNPSDYDLDQQPASNFGDSSLDEGKFDNEIHENKNWSNDATNDHSRDSELVPGGTTLTPRTKLPIPLHDLGVDCNGRLPIEAPQYEGKEDMDEEATQPATQPFDDPRRRGIRSELSEQEYGDVILELHPSSPAAHIAVRLTAAATPQHILQNHFMSPDDDFGIDEGPTQDIALRFSSKVHDLGLGFVFGRNPSKCDILLSDSPGSTISNRHFRIFLRDNGVAMIQDTSTNGTILNSDVLHAQKGNIGRGDGMYTIKILDTIEIPLHGEQAGSSLRFLVKEPSRGLAGDVRYERNKEAYLECVRQAQRQAAVVAQAVATSDAPPAVPVPLNPVQHGLPQTRAPNTSILTAMMGTHKNGMQWDGGEKYNVIKFIGEGAFAKVLQVSTKRDGEIFAAKQLEKRRFVKDGHLGSKVYFELNVMKNLSHPNIVRYVDDQETSTHLYIIMEFVPHGDLSAWICSKSAMPEYLGVKVASQIIGALDYLHSLGITHRDLKPDNILVAGDVFKLSDFGLSKMITNEETFLKTFCGTLLYLAPEVYPGYQRVRAGLPRRTRTSRDVVVPYQHSVDTWSLGAVLFHLLCASPPFEASADHQGEMMLLVIMNSNLNWNKVRRVGVSDKGIDFLSRMLVTEPSQRASDEELLHHSWIIGQNGRADPSSLEELAASQLSIADGVPDPTSGLGGYDDGQEEASYDWRNEETIDMTNPPPPNPLYDYTAGRPAVANRLFGEITNSALRSSGVLGENAHSALQMTGPGSYDPSPSGSYIQTRGGGKEFTSAEIAEASRLNSELSNLYNEEVAQSNTPQEGYPLGFSSAASSLLGAEALVDQLNMASPDSGNSLQSGGTKPATPKTSHRELMPAPSLLKRFSRDLETDVAVHHSKRFKSHHAESQSSRVARPSIEQSGQDRSVKNNAGVGGHGTGFFGHNEPSAPSHYSPVTRDFEPHSVDQQFGPRASDSIPESRRASDNQHTSHIPLSRDEEDQIEADRIIDEEIAMHQQELAKLHARKRTSHPGSSHSNTPSIDPNPTTQAHSTTLGPSTNHVPSANTSNVTAGKEFAEPRSRSVSTFGTTGDTSKQTILYGTLTPVKGSVHTLPEIQIREPNISFGRATNSTFIHPDGKEDRVPLRCFYIQMRYKGIDADIAAGIKELYKNPDITAVIGTRTKHYIKVNGVRLEAGKDCWQYGNLKTGDVITVFEPPEGQKARSKKDLEFLKFECEFYVGKSMQVRRATDPFKVEEEKSKYQEYMRRKKPGSEASERSKASEGAKAGEGENSNEGGKTTIIEGGKPTEGGKASEGTTAGSSSASGAKQGVQSS